MKKSLLFSCAVLVLEIFNLQAQTADLIFPGFPCKSKYYTASDSLCTSEKPLIDTITFTGSTNYTYVNENNLELFSITLDQDYLDSEYIFGEVSQKSTQYPAHVYYSFSAEGFEDISLDDATIYYEDASISELNMSFSLYTGIIIVKVGENYEFFIPISFSTENTSTLSFVRGRNFKSLSCEAVDPELIYTYNFTYDTEGNITSMFYDSERFNVDYTANFTYDGNNNLLTYSRIESATNKEVQFRTFVYNANNQLTVRYKEYENTKEADTIKYNANGLIVYHKLHYNYSVTDYIYEEEEFYEYESNGDLKKIRFIDQYGDITIDSVINKINDSTYRFIHKEYNSSLDLIDMYESEISFRAGAFTQFEMEFPQVYEKNFDMEGALTYYGLNEFNQNGDLVISKSFFYDLDNPNGYLYSSDSIVYTFDSEKVWSKRMVYRYDSEREAYVFVNQRENSCFGSSLGIAKTANPNENIQVYPNPVASKFFVHSDSPVLGIKLHNSNGTLISEWNNDESEYHIETMKQGIYFVEIKTEKGTISRKIVVE